MAYGRMRQIDKMSIEEFKALPKAERDLYMRTPKPWAQLKAIFDRWHKNPPAPKA